ncbi:hypothetical protein ACIQ8D_31275 [Streptomyces sp. NPDC096094]|uniref:hypothetical protein n=1 Tax=Streptomyces sp. NPDC096094 TaxID=3366073 RepID=UPI003819F62D
MAARAEASRPSVHLAFGSRDGLSRPLVRREAERFLTLLPESVNYLEHYGLLRDGVHAGNGNVLDNPHPGMLFMGFTHHRIGLHVNGTAHVVSEGRRRPVVTAQLDCWLPWRALPVMSAT